MPSIQKFHANVARHVNMMDKNLCANLIRHEAILTTRTKAKRSQSKIESFLSRSLKINKELSKNKDDSFEFKFRNNKAFDYLQPPDRNEIGGKVIKELSKRYPKRVAGFTRLIKLEPRLGEDKAPMAVLELVDSAYELQFWFVAKIVARLELQKLKLDDTTAHNVSKLVAFRNNGEQEFRNAVEVCKIEFFKYDPETDTVTDNEMKENLKNLPSNLEYYGGELSGKVVVSKKYKTEPRPSKQETYELPKSPFLTESA
ncbi:ribosomal protein L17 [Scheffersomyces coipomensis]|uniref:ribosomal protein L17 n=1 Tax=Scheffersomyces coipomensis TaxID=1788519 RepID=UPI00315D8CA2